MRIARTIEIVRAIDDVFAFVADARNDPTWCRKVLSVEQVHGHGPGPGARYRVVHRPIPLRPSRKLVMTCVGWQPPQLVEWHEADAVDIFEVTYELVETVGGTRLTQRDSISLGAPRVLHNVLKWGIARDVAAQLRDLKAHLER